MNDRTCFNNQRAQTPRVVLGALVALIAGVSNAATIKEGWDGVSGEDDFGVRFRSFQPTGGQEVFLGIPDLGSAENRVAQQLTWESESSTFELNYDPTTDLLTSVVGKHETLSYDFAEDLSIHTLHLSLADRDEKGDIWITDLTVNGERLGDFGFEQEGWFDWMITDLAKAEGLSVTGTIHRTGTFSSSQELSRIQITARGTKSPVKVADAAPGILIMGMGFVAMTQGRRYVARRRGKRLDVFNPTPEMGWIRS